MTEQPQKEETLFIFKELEANPNATQRDLSSRLNISLGKTNYLLRELILRGFIKVKNFTSNPGKLMKIHYLLTEKGLEEKFRLLQHFLQIKEIEYNKLKQEIEKIGGHPAKQSVPLS
ncbi:MAG: MarR family EPS-associated transcriptional regulator [Candidatus Omnitrophica bacterium]|nr:MarR family EPS-associated transcriptional regulator [Candidatus Omnitrophota bacterium]MCG2707971.1 MarR family EPS-associated transcriptional regulator [Candidatus Omnitrophota bacterium]